MSFGIPVRNGLGLGLTPSTTLSSGRTGPRPALTLNFLTSTALSSNVTFSRGSNATLTDSTGKITYAPNNLLTNSESFETAWTTNSGTVTANVGVAPDGTTTADQIAGAASSGGIYRFVTVVNGARYTASVYAKYVSGSTNFRYGAESSPAAGVTIFNISAGTVVSNGADVIASSITSVGNGWYRCAVTFVATSTSTGLVCYASGSAGTWLQWGAQLEQVTYQTTPGTYNSTTPKNLLGYTQEFDNAAWTKTRSFVQTNLLLRSNDFATSPWSSSAGVTLTSATTTAPDGTASGWLWTRSSTSSSFTTQVVTKAASALTYTGSFYVKRSVGNFCALRIQGLYPARADVVFNLSTGTISTAATATSAFTGASADIQSVGNGWYRILLSATSDATTSIQAVVSFNSNNVQIDGTDSVSNSAGYVWGAQLVQGATAGNYQPTYAAAAAVQYAAPDGTLSADKLVVDTTAGSHIAFQQIATQQAGTYTFSVYAKAAEISTVTLQQTISTTYAATFDLTSGAVSGIVGGATASATAVGNGWYRCSITYTTVAAIALTGAIYTGFPPNDGTSGIYVWGAQLSNSASLDPYVYNPGAAPTSAAYYGPRFDYDPVTLAPKGLLIEEQRTNLTTYSEQFNNAAWGLNAASATPNVTTAPDGTTSADKLVEGASTATHGLDAPAAAITAGTTYTGSLYAKASERRYLFVALTYSGFTSGNGVCFDLQTGTIVGSGTGSASAGAITPVGNGWYRCSITLAATVSGTFIGAPAVYLSDTATNSLKSYTGDGTSGAFVWGAQLEAGAFATSYIPTVASTVTRSADVAQMLGTNFSSWYNQTQGAFVVSGDSAGGAVSGLYEASTSGTAAQSISVRLGQKFSYAQGLNRFDFSYTAGNVIRHGFAYLAGNYGAAVGGTALAVNANGQPADVPAGANQLALGCLGSGTFLLNGHIRTLSYYNTRLTNTQLQALTA